MSKGWISIHREIQSHWLWKEKREFSKLEAWLDILLTVNHSEQKILIKNTLFTVKRGESIKSLDTWANRWNWNKSKVRRFLNVLQNDNMIVTKSELKTTRLTVCKYDSYQDVRNDNETIMKRKRNDNETQTTPNNNDINNDNKIIDHENFKNECLNSKIWQEQVAMNIKTHIDNIPLALKKFNEHLITTGENKMYLKDYKSHFMNWFRIIYEKEIKNK